MNNSHKKVVRVIESVFNRISLSFLSLFTTRSAVSPIWFENNLVIGLPAAFCLAISVVALQLSLETKETKPKKLKNPALYWLFFGFSSFSLLIIRIFYFNFEFFSLIFTFIAWICLFLFSKYRKMNSHKKNAVLSTLSIILCFSFGAVLNLSFFSYEILAAFGSFCLLHYTKRRLRSLIFRPKLFDRLLIVAFLLCGISVIKFYASPLIWVLLIYVVLSLSLVRKSKKDLLLSPEFHYEMVGKKDRSKEKGSNLNNEKEKEIKKMAEKDPVPAAIAFMKKWIDRVMVVEILSMIFIAY